MGIKEDKQAQMIVGAVFRKGEGSCKTYAYQDGKFLNSALSEDISDMEYENMEFQYYGTPT